MWKCPKCGREWEGDKCLECGIENLDGKVGNIVGGDNNGEYFMVSADFFKKKKVNIFGLIGFILSIIAALFAVCMSFDDGLGRHFFYYNVEDLYLIELDIILSIVLNIIGIKRFNAKTQTCYWLAVAGTYIAIMSLGYFIGAAVGYWFW